jgi:hypothetical protein
MMRPVEVGRHGSVGLLATAAVCAFLTGCGSQLSVPAKSQRSQHQPIDLQSPAVAADGTISSRYQCANDIWLPLSWGQLPANAAEVVLYIGGYGPRTITPRGTILRPIVSGVLIAGLDPQVHTLKAGAPPPGATGFAAPSIPICPPRTHGGRFIIKAFALRAQDRISGDALESQQEPLELLENIAEKASGVGSLRARYP